ncbi:MAG TPA: ATP-binding cassette domain-containing protein, partial [Candidatus Hydrogenedentes bacterium]|nr:ATP-binding cassette domain-containing protein [Candidatus Hydrogenedentota bacterium]
MFEHVRERDAVKITVIEGKFRRLDVHAKHAIKRIARHGGGPFDHFDAADFLNVPFLFEGTVEDNIRFAVPEISRDEIFTLANQVGGGEWLETFSSGLDTQVGERGAHISMGQRQLVALMRVLAQKPAIFILD